jgi:glycosyltransferase involved in cell wall biosynthesis
MLSLILPVYNEEKNITRNFSKILRALSSMDEGFEIIIAEDGSDDGTLETAKGFARTYRNIRISHSDRRLGKGLAINRAALIARGDKIGYLDIDLSPDIERLSSMSDMLQEYDVVVGSRLIKRSSSKRKIQRYFLSVSYNFIIRVLFRSRIRDHQCGMKLFRGNVFRDLISESKSDRWFFDTELLLLAQRKGLRIKEYPVPWKESEESKVNTNLIVLQMLKEIVHSLFTSKNKRPPFNS